MTKLAQPLGAPAQSVARPLTQFTQDGAWRLNTVHDRKEALLFWITKAQGTLTLEGIKQGLSGPTVLYIPAHTLFSLALTPGAFGTAVSLSKAQTEFMPTTPVALRVIDMGEQRVFAGHFENLTRELANTAPGQDLAVTAHAMLTSVWLERQLALQSYAKPSANARLMRDFAKRIVASYATGCGVGAIAEEIGVTPTHLSRVCNASLGVSSSKLLADRVFYQARALLHDTDKTAQDIAKDLGFSSAPYFTRAFQAHVGQTPSAFRALKTPAQAA